MENFNRITREQMFIEMTITASKRSTCKRKQVGCLLVRDNRIVAMGYNGVLPKVDPKEGLNPDGSSRTVHAEANMIAFCAKNGIKTEGCILYCSLQPCEKCSELIIQSGISKVYYIEEYRDKSGIELLIKHKVETCQVCIK